MMRNTDWIAALPEPFRGLRTEAEAEFAQKGTFFLQEEYLRTIQTKWNPFPRIFPEVLTAAEEMRKDPDAAWLSLFVFRCMQKRELFRQYRSRFEVPEEEYPFFLLFCLVPTVETSGRFLREKNLPEDVIAATLVHSEECVFLTQERTSRFGLSQRYFGWLQNYVDCRMLNVNRLRFERTTVQFPVFLLEHRVSGEQILLMTGEMTPDGLCRQSFPGTEEGFRAEFCETDSEFTGHCVLPDGRCSPERRRFSKQDYRLLLSPGDNCLSVHIPDKSKGPLTEEACQSSYDRALALFREHFPEFPVKALVCHSWMLSQELKPLLRENSNLLQFQKKFRIFPTPSAGTDVFNFVFLRTDPSLPYETLPEETSLQKKIKQVYQSGGRIYEYGGICPVNESFFTSE